MDERKVEQVVTDGGLACQVQGKSYRLKVHDLSAKGCMRTAPDAKLADGEHLVLDFLDGIAGPGRIAWQCENCLGVEFEEVLQPVVVRRLGHKIPNERADRFVSRDRFGRPLERLPICPDEFA